MCRRPSSPISFPVGLASTLRWDGSGRIYFLEGNHLPPVELAMQWKKGITIPWWVALLASILIKVLIST